MADQETERMIDEGHFTSASAAQMTQILLGIPGFSQRLETAPQGIGPEDDVPLKEH